MNEEQYLQIKRMILTYREKHDHQESVVIAHQIHSQCLAGKSALLSIEALLTLLSLLADDVTKGNALRSDQLLDEMLEILKQRRQRQ